MALLSGVKARIHEVRERRPLVDHVVRMVEHYGDVNGSALAAAVTYFAFLSFFPILALAFAVFGQVTKVYANAQDTLLDAAELGAPQPHRWRERDLASRPSRALRPASSASASCWRSTPASAGSPACARRSSRCSRSPSATSRAS